MGLKEELLTVDMAKTATSTITGIGINEIVTQIVASNVPHRNILQRVCVFTGRMVLVSMINAKAKEHTDAGIDSAVTWYKEITDINPTGETNGG